VLRDKIAIELCVGLNCRRGWNDPFKQGMIDDGDDDNDGDNDDSALTNAS
jgi:hypothetical protein